MVTPSCPTIPTPTTAPTARPRRPEPGRSLVARRARRARRCCSASSSTGSRGAGGAQPDVAPRADEATLRRGRGRRRAAADPASRSGCSRSRRSGSRRSWSKAPSATRLKAGPGHDPASAFPGRARRHARPRPAQLLRQAVRPPRPAAQRRPDLAHDRRRAASPTSSTRARRGPGPTRGARTLTLATVVARVALERRAHGGRASSTASRCCSARGRRPREDRRPGRRRRLLPRLRRDRSRRSSGARCSSARSFVAAADVPPVAVARLAPHDAGDRRAAVLPARQPRPTLPVTR